MARRLVPLGSPSCVRSPAGTPCSAVRGTGSTASPIRSGIPLRRGTSSEGGSVRGSPCNTPARLRTGLQGPIPGRSRHSRAAASAPASLPSLTVPQRVRLGRAPCRKRRIDPLDARPLPERPPGRRPHSDPHPAAATPATKDPGRSGGFREAACGARCNSGERNRQRAGGGRERSGGESPASQGPSGAVRGLLLREQRPGAPTHMADTARFPRLEGGR